ncbi:MAG: hypothetical protein RLZZ595_449 [Bacteroidota bacterium]
MRGITYILLFSMFTFPVAAQVNSVALLQKKIQGEFSYFMPDELGNVFALTLKGQLKKYNNNLDSMGVFNDVRRYGKLYSISLENPLRTVLYFKDYKTILVLDRLMQVVNKIDLRKAGIFQVKAVAQSYDNLIWVFDEQESKLKKINEEGQLVFATADLRLVFSEAIVPSVIFDLGGFVYLYDENKGLFIFDYYGAYKNRIALLNWKDVHPVGKQIVGIKNSQLMVYTTGSIDTKEYALPKEIADYQQIHFTVGSCYVLTGGGISKYDLKN